MSVAIRNAVPGDEDVILRFIEDLAAYEKLSNEVVATTSSLTRTLFSTTPMAFALIAENDGEPAGFALYFFNYSTFLGKHGLYLEDLYVREAHRSAGLGKALLAHLAAIAKENDCGRMEWSVLDWNADAISFYKSLGAAPMNGWDIYRLTGDGLSLLAQSGGQKTSDQG